jgi:hypothetical protein
MRRVIWLYTPTDFGCVVELFLSDLRQTEIYTTQPIMPRPIAFGIEMAIAKVKFTSPGIDQIPAALIKAGV